MWRKILRDIEIKTIDSLYSSYGEIENRFAKSKKNQNELVHKSSKLNEKIKQKIDRYMNTT